MDKTPQQLLATAKKILAELQSLNDNLQKQSDAIAKNSQPAKQDINITPEVRAVLDLPESEQARQRAADASQKRYQKRNLLVSWLTLFALVAYAIVTALIYRASEDAAKAAQTAADAASAQAVAASAQAVAASAQTANSAKAAALSRETLELQYGTRIRLIVGLYALKPQPKIEAAVQFFGIGGPTGDGRPIERMRVLSKVEFRKLVPKRDEPITDSPYVPPYKEACRNPNAKKVRAAKQTCGYRMWNPAPMSDYDDYMAGRKSLYIWGHATYQDAVGPHEWDFCEYTTVDKVKTVTEKAPASFNSFQSCDDRERYDE